MSEEKGAEHVQEVPGRSVAVHTDTFDISEDAIGSSEPGDYYRNWRFIGVAFACVLANNAQIAPYILAANSYPAIEADLGQSSTIVWVNLAFTLCISVSMLITGRLTDIFGRRWFVVGANAMGCLGCIIASTASSVNTIVGGTVFIGLAAAVQLNFPAIISELVPKRHRSVWVGTTYGSSIGFYGFGSIIAFKFVENNPSGWRWCYRVGIILSGTASLVYFLCYHPPKFQQLHMNRSKLEQLKRQDYIGLFLFSAGLILFVLGLSWGGNLYPWKSARVISTIVVGSVTLIVFGLYEVYMTKKVDQILPTHLFKAPGYIPMVILAAVGTVVAYSGLVFWPQQVHAIIIGSPTRLALLSSVLGCTNLLGFIMGGLLYRYCKWHRTILIVSSAILAAFCGAMSAVQPGDDVMGPALVSFVMIPIGIIEVGARALLPLTCPDEDIGAALGALGSIGYACASVGLAIYSAVLTNKIKSVAIPAIARAAVEAGLPESSVPELLASLPAELASVPGIDEEIILAVAGAAPQGYADAFRYIWYCALAFSLCALTSSFFTVNYEKYMTDSVARKLGHGRKVQKESQVVNAAA